MSSTTSLVGFFTAGRLLVFQHRQCHIRILQMRRYAAARGETSAITNGTFVFSAQVNPKGMAYTATVIVQLHPLFTTKVDRAFRLRCFYKEAEKAVGAEVSVRYAFMAYSNKEGKLVNS